MAVERMRSSEKVGELARELGVTRRCLYKWRAKLDLVGLGEESARPNTHESSYRKQAQQLKRLLAEKTMEVDFFKGALQEVEARANGAAILARWHLRLDPRSDVIARQFEYRAHV